jgi:hypothetical protein
MMVRYLPGAKNIVIVYLSRPYALITDAIKSGPVIATKFPEVIIEPLATKRMMNSSAG